MQGANKGLCAGCSTALCDSITTAKTEKWSGGVTEGALSRADTGRHREDSDAVVTVKDIQERVYFACD